MTILLASVASFALEPRIPELSRLSLVGMTRADLLWLTSRELVVSVLGGALLGSLLGVPAFYALLQARRRLVVHTVLAVLVVGLVLAPESAVTSDVSIIFLIPVTSVLVAGNGCLFLAALTGALRRVPGARHRPRTLVALANVASGGARALSATQPIVLVFGLVVPLAMVMATGRLVFEEGVSKPLRSTSMATFDTAPEAQAASLSPSAVLTRQQWVEQGVRGAVVGQRQALAMIFLLPCLLALAATVLGVRTYGKVTAGSRRRMRLIGFTRAELRGECLAEVAVQLGVIALELAIVLGPGAWKVGQMAAASGAQARPVLDTAVTCVAGGLMLVALLATHLVHLRAILKEGRTHETL